MRARIKSYEQLLNIFKSRMKDVLFFDGKVNETTLFNNYFFFRGEANARWRLTPKANRKKKYDPVDIDTSDDSRLGVFAKMYGKSDRTIDFTADLKLALYHACSDEQYKDVDGKIYVYITPYWCLNKFASAIARYFEDNKDKYKDKVIDIAYELSQKDDVRWLLNHYDNPSEEVLTYLCLMINQFLTKDSFVIFDESIYDKYPKIKKERGAIYYCGPKIYEKRKKTVKQVSLLLLQTRAGTPNYCYRVCNSPHTFSNNCIAYKIAAESKKQILAEIGKDI